MIGIIISILLVVGCIAVIIVLVWPKLALLASIDTKSLPEERARNVKNKIISERIRRKFHTARKMTSVVTLPFASFTKNVGHRMGALQKTVADLRDKQRRAAVIGGATARSEESMRAGTLLEQADHLVNEGRFDEAEKRYIDAIALDANSMEAYEGLADIYMSKKEWDAAREVLDYLCKRERDLMATITPDEQGSLPAQLAKHLYDLSEVHLALEDKETALAEILEAVALDKNNPKLLDALVEMYIVQKQKLRAERALDQLRRANPENKKVDELAGRIAELPY